VISAKSESRLWELICKIGGRVDMRRSGTANDANKSILLDDDMICRVDRDGDPRGRDAYRPSAEIKLHLRLYDCREDVRAVVHAHPLYTTVDAICGKPLVQQAMPESTMFLGEVPLAPYGLRPATTGRRNSPRSKSIGHSRYGARGSTAPAAIP
jgi:L-fuculose-phosphate aldolase